MSTPAQNPVRVLIVDDSATMRSLISAVLRRDPEIAVVGTAADPLEARAAIKGFIAQPLFLQQVESARLHGARRLDHV